MSGGPIPAGAGQTPPRPACSRSPGADPRGRGADSAECTPATRNRGRSPRARGRRPGHSPRSGPSWPIPAGAGQTCNSRRHNAIFTADPRGRGADSFRVPSAAFSHGRSPRARGRPPPSARSMSGSRPIPAGAGQTGSREVGEGVPKADPRGRGADDPPSAVVPGEKGRSPRARGRPLRTP